MFHVGYTLRGVWKLLHRHGWSAQVPVRRVIERADEAVEVWKDEVCPQVEHPRDLGAASASRRPRGAGRGAPPSGGGKAHEGYYHEC
jgi:putative transposase